MLKNKPISNDVLVLFKRGNVCVIRLCLKRSVSEFRETLREITTRKK